MVEVVIFKVPDGTKDVLKALANRRGYMGLSDFLRDLVRREYVPDRSFRTSEGMSFQMFVRRDATGAGR